MELYAKYKSKDFEILAFPCNQFGAQESGSSAEIKAFVKTYTRAKVKRYTENGRKPGVYRGYRARGGDNFRDGEIGSRRRPIRGRRVKTTATRQHRVASY